MRTFSRALSLCTIAVCLVLIQACSTQEQATDSSSNTTNNQTLDSKRNAIIAKSGAEAADRIMNLSQKQATLQDVTYNDTLCPGETAYGSWGGSYAFYAVAGTSVHINVDRIGCGMDPAFDLYEVSSGTWLGWADDNDGPASGCGCFGDPSMTFTAPSTGWYSVSVWEFAGCDSDKNFSITVSGSVCDTDGDGVNDSDDAYPNSDLQANVVIDGCDSGIGNHLFPNGATMMDYINTCAANAADHSEFVDCVAQRTNSWKSAGLITGAQKGAIQSCAGQANLP